LLRPGRAGSNTAVDHVTVLDTALAQIPAVLHTPGRPAARLAALRDSGAPIEPRRVADLPVTRVLS
jgi:hypothetical protein